MIVSHQKLVLDFGVLFLAKGLVLTRKKGVVALVQSAGALLFNSTEVARRLQKKVFLQSGQIETVINLAAFRWSTVRLFKDVRVPTCVVFIRNISPTGTEFLYECPKPLHNGEDSYKFVIDNSDAYWVFAQEMVDDPWLWSTLMWGGLRDVSLVRKLKQHSNLQALMDVKVALSRQGIIKGRSRQRTERQIIGRRLLTGSDFPVRGSFKLNGQLLKVASAEDAVVHEDDSTNFDAFALPQLIVKTSWTQSAFRFQAQVVETNNITDGIVPSRSFISVHVKESKAGFLDRACICYNSSIATYYLFLTSGRFAFDRSEPLIEELRSIPLPPIEMEQNNPGLVFETLDEQAIDRAAFDLFRISDADQVLVNDIMNYKLPDFKGERDFPGYKSTSRAKNRGDVVVLQDDIHLYADTLIKVLGAAYGAEKRKGGGLCQRKKQELRSARSHAPSAVAPPRSCALARPPTTAKPFGELATRYGSTGWLCLATFHTGSRDRFGLGSLSDSSK